jgi:DNA-binding NarL/FixJ family response regulator
MDENVICEQSLSANIDRNGRIESRQLRAVQMDHGRVALLTKREIDVLALLAEGLGNKQIARALILSPHTVKAYVTSILHKLNAESRTEAAVLWATREK